MRLLHAVSASAAFVRDFMRFRGNLKEMERESRESYWTLRTRLSDVIKEMGYDEEEAVAPDGGETSRKRREVLDRLAAKEISAAEAAGEVGRPRGQGQGVGRGGMHVERHSSVESHGMAAVAPLPWRRGPGTEPQVSATSEAAAGTVHPAYDEETTVNEDRVRVLTMLHDGQITVDERGCSTGSHARAGAGR